MSSFDVNDQAQEWARTLERLEQALLVLRSAHLDDAYRELKVHAENTVAVNRGNQALTE